MRHWKIILSIGVVFCCGVAIGCLFTLKSIEKRISQRMDPQTWAPRTMAWLESELLLTPEQQKTVRPYVDDMTSELEQLKKDAELERKAIFGRMLAQIQPTLSPKQKTSLKSAISKSKTP